MKKNILKIILVYIIVSINALESNAQNATANLELQKADASVSFETFMQTYKEKLIEQLGSDTNAIIKKFYRATNYYEGRTARNFPLGLDRFTAAAAAFKNASDNRNSICANLNPTFNGNWELLGPLNLDAQQYGLVYAIWVNPTNSNEILVATFGGIFKTTNANDSNGSDWTNITDGANNILPSGFYTTSLAVNPADHNIIYVGTIIFDGCGFYNSPQGGNGLIKSTDGGLTWQKESELNTVIGNSDYAVSNVSFNQDGTIIYAFTSNGFYAKANIGNWQQLNSSNRGRDIELRPNHSTEAWLSEGGAPGMKTYLSQFDNLTQTFSLTDITQDFDLKILPGTAPTSVATTMGAPWNFEISAQDENTLWAMTNRHPIITLPSRCCTEFGGTICSLPGDECILWKYDVPSNAWSFVSRSSDLQLPSFYYGGYCFEKAKNEPNKLYIGRDVLYSSTDGGITFNEISTYFTDPATQSTHADIRSILIYNVGGNSNGSEDIVYFGTDGGLGIKPQGLIPNSITSTKDFSGNGIPCSQFYGLATSEFGGMIIGGTMHDGGQAFEPSKTPKWICLSNLGDSYGAVFEKNKPQKGYIKNGLNGYSLKGSQSNSQRTLANFSGSSYFGTNQDGNRETFITPYFSDKRGNIYWPQARLWRKLANGSSFEDVTNEGIGPNSQEIPNFNGLDISPSVDNHTNIHRLAIDFDNETDNILHGYIAYSWGSHTKAKKLLEGC